MIIYVLHLKAVLKLSDNAIPKFDSLINVQ